MPRYTQGHIEFVPGLEELRVVQIADFLPEEERNAIFELLCENEQKFHAPGHLSNYEGQSLYLSLDQNEARNTDSNSEALEIVRKTCECLSSRILDLLPNLFPILNIEPFRVEELPLSWMNGRNGHTGIPHSDESGGRYQISLLYYLHNQPKVFRGGALQFYETDATSPTGHKNTALATVEHRDNLLLVYPSVTFHGITDVESDSDEFSDGRFVGVGFLGRT